MCPLVVMVMWFVWVIWEEKKILQKAAQRSTKGWCFPYKKASARNADHKWLIMTNAFILCDLLWKVKKSYAAKREGRFIVHTYEECWNKSWFLKVPRPKKTTLPFCHLSDQRLRFWSARQKIIDDIFFINISTQNKYNQDFRLSSCENEHVAIIQTKGVFSHWHAQRASWQCICGHMLIKKKLYIRYL